MKRVRSCAAKTKDANQNLNIPDDYEIPFYPIPRKIDENLLGDLTGGRPGAIIETEEQLATKDRILQEIENGKRQYDETIMRDYGNLIEELERWGASFYVEDLDARQMLEYFGISEAC